MALPTYAITDKVHNVLDQPNAFDSTILTDLKERMLSAFYGEDALKVG